MVGQTLTIIVTSTLFSTCYVHSALLSVIHKRMNLLGPFWILYYDISATSYPPVLHNTSNLTVLQHWCNLHIQKCEYLLSYWLKYAKRWRPSFISNDDISATGYPTTLCNISNCSQYTVLQHWCILHILKCERLMSY